MASAAKIRELGRLVPTPPFNIVCVSRQEKGYVYLTQYIQNVFNSTCNQHFKKLLMSILYYFLHMYPSKLVFTEYLYLNLY